MNENTQMMESQEVMTIAVNDPCISNFYARSPLNKRKNTIFNVLSVFALIIPLSGRIAKSGLIPEPTAIIILPVYVVKEAAAMFKNGAVLHYYIRLCYQKRSDHEKI